MPDRTCENRGPGALSFYLAGRETEFFISRFVDYASADGMFRKYRIVMVDGKAYACHMAIAEEWKVWYLNADMALSASHRMEEALFMQAFDRDFAVRHAAALGEMAERIGLDYVAIDCAETKEGALLVFEADNTAIVHDMDPPNVYPTSPRRCKDFQGGAGHAVSPRRTPSRGCGMTKAWPPVANRPSLDPEDWTVLRAQAHRMLDDMLDYVAHIRERPVWVPMPQSVRDHFQADIGDDPTPLEEVHREFMDTVLPYAGGNVHPGFMGWVQGGGTATGMLAEMLAGGLNANLGGRDHAPIEVERQMVAWVRRLFGFPESASGLFVTGTSMANLLAVLVARTARLGTAARQDGIGPRAEAAGLCLLCRAWHVSPRRWIWRVSDRCASGGG